MVRGYNADILTQPQYAMECLKATTDNGIEHYRRTCPTPPFSPRPPPGTLGGSRPFACVFTERWTDNRSERKPGHSTNDRPRNHRRKSDRKTSHSISRTPTKGDATIANPLRERTLLKHPMRGASYGCAEHAERLGRANGRIARILPELTIACLKVHPFNHLPDHKLNFERESSFWQF